MIIKDSTFQEINHKYLILNFNSYVKDALKGFNGLEFADSFLAFGYNDKNIGLTLEILCLALHFENRVILFEGNEELVIKIKVDNIKELEFSYLSSNDERINQFKHKLFVTNELEVGSESNTKIVKYY